LARGLGHDVIVFDPWVNFEPLEGNALLGVHCKDAFQQVFPVFGNMAGKFLLGIANHFLQFFVVAVFLGQVSTHHGE